MTGFDPEAWKNTSIDNESKDPPPEGEYEVAIDNAEFFTSKAGNAVIKLSLRVTSAGDEQGWSWDEIRGMGTEGQMKAAKATCARLGIDVDAIDSEDQLNAELEACIGRYYEVAVKQNGDYLNCYINSRVHGVDEGVPDFRPAAGGTPAAVGADDDIPFLWRPVEEYKEPRAYNPFA